MNLSKKKALAAKVLKVGKNRISFEVGDEIKEAITRQDILDLHEMGLIRIKEVKGRKKIVRRKHRRGIGKVKKRVKTRKQDYTKLTRKLRKVTKALLRLGKFDKVKYHKARKMIKAGKFKSKRHLHESVEEI